MPKSNVGNFHFEGFNVPNTTPVPDELFDFLLPKLKEAELRVLLYIIRRTLGFKKSSDRISLKQLVEGIRASDGRVIDYGAGVAKSAAARATRSLVVKGILLTMRNSSPEKGDEPTTYILHFKSTPVSSKETRGDTPKGHPRVLQKDTQQTVLQQTEDIYSKRKILKRKGLNRQDGQPSSIGHILSHTNRNYFKPELTRAHQALDVLITDVSAELGDTQHLWSNLTQASNLHQASGLSEVSFVQLAYEAASVVRDKLHANHSDTKPIKNKMAYYFATLKESLAAGKEP